MRRSITRSDEGNALSRLFGALRYAASPWNWRTLGRRVWRNPAFFADLLEYANAQPETRRRALRRIVKHLYRRALEGDVEDWATSTKGFASTIASTADALVSQLGETHHLGALGGDAPTISRLEYTYFINHILLAMKEEFAGYGLGASDPDFRALPSGAELTRLTIAQSWSFLLNAGHLFGTFATERALLFELVRDGRVDEFLAGVAEPLRASAARLIAARGLNQFYYALACWRISRASIDDGLRADCIALLESYFRYRESSRVPVHYWAFRAARQLAYNRLHLYMGVGHPVDAVNDDAAVRALSPWGSLGYESRLGGESSSLAVLLDSIDRYQADSYFASAATASSVLAHVRAFRIWWKSHRANLPDAIDALFGKAPADWPELRPEPLVHFARLHLPGRGADWLDEVRAWKEPYDGADPWETAFFLVSPRSTQGLVCDVYLRSGTNAPASAVRQTARRLSAHSESTWKSDPDPNSREVWRSLAAFGLRMLSELCDAPYEAILHPARMSEDANHGHVGYAVVSTPAIAAIERARTLANHITDPIRQRELRAAAVLVEETAAKHTDAPMLLFVGSTCLVERTKQQKLVAEFDGAWCFFGEDRTTWFLMEHKKGSRAANPRTALSSKCRYLRDRWSPYDVVSHDCGGDVAVITFSTPGPPAAT